MNPTILLDIGNLLFFIAMLPQMITAYKNRRNLTGLSFGLLTFFFAGTIFFAIGNYLVGAAIAPILCVIELVLYATQLFWKVRYRNVSRNIH